MALIYGLTAELSIISHVVILYVHVHKRKTLVLTCISVNILLLNQSLCVLLLFRLCVSVAEHFYQCYRITHIHHRLNMHLIMTFYSSGSGSGTNMMYIIFPSISLLYTLYMWCVYALFIFTTVFHPSTNQNMST